MLIALVEHPTLVLLRAGGVLLHHLPTVLAGDAGDERAPVT